MLKKMEIKLARQLHQAVIRFIIYSLIGWNVYDLQELQELTFMCHLVSRTQKVLEFRQDLLESSPQNWFHNPRIALQIRRPLLSVLNLLGR